MVLFTLRWTCLFIVVLVVESAWSANVLVPLLPGSKYAGGIDGFSPHSNIGAFAYNIPLILPPGRNHLQPSLSLNYRSDLGNGTLGLGWEMPLPSIRWNPKYGVPPKKGPFPLDAFYSSVYGELIDIGNGYFRPKKSKEYILFKFLGNRWIQWDTSGNRWIYSENGGIVDPHTNQTFQWRISVQIDSTCINSEDLNCNKISYYYRQDPSSLLDHPGQNLQIYINRIEYNYFDGTGKAIVAFDYESRKDDFLSFYSGFPTQTSLILSKIRILWDQMQIREYRLIHSDNFDSTRTALSQLQITGRNHIPIDQFNFGYSKHQDSYVEKPLLGIPKYSLEYADSSRFFMFADINGDARPDLYSQNGKEVSLYSNLGSDQTGNIIFGPRSSYGNNELFSLDNPDNYFADINGDGVLDLVEFYDGLKVRQNGLTGWLPRRSLVDSAAIKIKQTNSMMIDINGDGLSDILNRQDSQKDLCLINHQNIGWNAEITPQQENLLPRSFYAGATGLKVGDINGDGLNDLLLLSGNNLEIALNMGNCNWSKIIKTQLIGAEGKSLNIGKEHFYVGDIDGDGLVDISLVYLKSLLIWKNYGHFHFEVSSVKELSSLATWAGLADMNSDGVVDIAYCSIGPRCFYLDKKYKGKSGLLTSIEIESGKKINIQYLPSSSFAARNWTSRIPFVTQVPTLVGQWNGLGLDEITTFQYDNPFYSQRQRRFNGFEMITTSIANSHESQNSYKEQQVFDTAADDGESSSILSGELVSRIINSQLYHYYSYEYQKQDNVFLLQKASSRRELTIDGQVMSNSQIQIFDPFIQISQEMDFEGSKNGNHLEAQLRKNTQYEFTRSHNSSSETYRLKDENDKLFIFPKLEVVKNSLDKVIKHQEFEYELNFGRLIETKVYTAEQNYFSTFFEYDDTYLKNPILSKDDRGDIIQKIGYDRFGLFPKIIENGEGEKTLYSYDCASGNLISKMDENGLKTEFNYDDRERVWRTKELFNKQTKRMTLTTYFDGKFGVPSTISVRTQLNERNDFRLVKEFFDSDHRLLMRKSDGPQGNILVTFGHELDYLGRPYRELLIPYSADNFDFEVLPDHTVTRLNHYDSFSRLERIDYPSEDLFEQFEYHIAPRPNGDSFYCEKSSNKNGHPRNECWDFFGHLRMVDLSGHFKTVYLYNYDANDNLTGIQFPSGKRRTFTRDLRGLSVLINDSSIGSISNTYDHRNRVILKEWNDEKYRFDYDKADRLTREDHGSSYLDFKSFIEVTYGNKKLNNFSVGRPAKIQYDIGAFLFSYYPTGEIELKEYIPSSGSRTGNIRYRYNWDGSIVQEIGNGHIINYDYDEKGYITGVPGIVNEVKYNSRGLTDIIGLSNGTQERRAYRKSNNQVEKISINSGSKSIFNEILSYGELDNIKSRTLNDQGIWTYDYDPDSGYQLILSQFNNEIPVRYEYDDDGKIINGEGGNSLSHRNSFGQVTNRGETHYDYSFGCLSQATSKANNKNIVFSCDKEQNWMARSEGQRMTHLRLDQKWEMTEEGTYFNLYLFGSPTARVNLSKKATQYLHTDSVGSVVAITDNNGNEIGHRAYGPFGKVYLHKSKEPFTFGFAGGREDTQTNLVSFGRRFYNSVFKEFMTPDMILLENADKTLKDPQQLYLFQYAKNNPLRYYDPSGQYSKELFEGYMTAGLTDLGHYIKYKAMSAYEIVIGIGNSEFTGGGIRPSVNFEVFKISGRFGYDTINGPEGYGEASYSFGLLKGAGQLGYSNGAIRAVGRVEGMKGDLSGGYSVGTSENFRGKLRLGPVDFQYNSKMSGRIDIALGKAYGVTWGGYGNFNLTSDSYIHFRQSSWYSEWSNSGMPYRGASW